jgi:hypothetical protein
VGPVAERSILGFLASAEPHRFLFFQLEGLRREFSTLVRTIAEGLLLGLTARTPPVLASFEVKLDRGLLWTNGLGHGFRSGKS